MVGALAQIVLSTIITAHDCDKAINSMLTEGQIEGCVVNGIGYDISEEIVINEGKVLNSQFTDYILSTALDVSNIIPIIVEHTELIRTFGEKAIGEPSLTPTVSVISIQFKMQ